MTLLNRSNNNAVLNNFASTSPNGITSSPVAFKTGRVKNIILDESNPKFKELGEWNALGYIEYQDITTPSAPINIAKPYFSNIKNLPLLEEIVWIVSLPDTSLNGTNQSAGISTNTSEYYICPTALWNHPHHNAYPTFPNALPTTQQKDYIQTQTGNVRRITDQSTEIFLGKTFKERSNIHPILPFEGDIIYEGRWGNSIRLGSTVQKSTNNWSVTGSNGDPITILRNGQGNQTEEGWVPTVEDINNDESSIYLTSTQKIPLNSSSDNYFSYKSNPPTNPKQYTGKQILINSGRLVFNSTNDHILLSSNKSINLNAQSGVNIDSPTFIIQTKNVYLGSKNATEPLLLGNRTINTLNNLITNLNAFITICTTLVSTPPGTPLVPLNTAATQLSQQLLKIQGNLDKLKSNTSYTI